MLSSHLKKSSKLSKNIFRSFPALAHHHQLHLPVPAVHPLDSLSTEEIRQAAAACRKEAAVLGWEVVKFNVISLQVCSVHSIPLEQPASRQSDRHIVLGIILLCPEWFLPASLSIPHVCTLSNSSPTRRSLLCSRAHLCLCESKHCKIRKRQAS